MPANVTNFFEFLKEKYPIPFSVKVKHDIPITEEDLKYKVKLRIRSGDDWGHKIPEGLHFKGGIDVSNYGYGEDFYLPEMTVDNDFEIYGNFTGDLEDVKINKGSSYQQRIAFQTCNNITTIPSYNIENATLSISECENFSHTPNNLNVQFLYLKGLPILVELGTVNTKMSINIYDCPQLTTLSTYTVCEWNCTLENLPKLMDLPYSLRVDRELTIKNCGIQKKYTVEELTERLPFVRKVIYS
jgi:hypothetical protein